MPYAIRCLDLSGRDITNWLQTLLNENGERFTTSPDFKIVRNIKETVKRSLEMGIELFLSSERFRCPEFLFKPMLNGFELEGTNQSLFDSIMKCDIDVRRVLYGKHCVFWWNNNVFRFP
jgi:actin-related protein